MFAVRRNEPLEDMFIIAPITLAAKPIRFNLNVYCEILTSHTWDCPVNFTTKRSSQNFSQFLQHRKDQKSHWLRYAPGFLCLYFCSRYLCPEGFLCALAFTETSLNVAFAAHAALPAAAGHESNSLIYWLIYILKKIYWHIYIYI